VIDEPANGHYASQVAAPVFADLARYALRQFRIPPPTDAYQPSVPGPTAAEMPIVDAAAIAAAEAVPVRNEAAVPTTTSTTAPVASGATTTVPGNGAPDPPDTG
jgi:hypothetical protein